MKNCIFCQIVNNKRPARIVYEDEDVVAFHDINPQAPIHILIIPRKHIPQISAMQPEDQLLVGKIIFTGKNLAEQLNIADHGFRMVFNNGRYAGQQIFHIHLHLLGGRPMSWPPG